MQIHKKASDGADEGVDLLKGNTSKEEMLDAYFVKDLGIKCQRSNEYQPIGTLRNIDRSDKFSDMIIFKSVLIWIKL